MGSAVGRMISPQQPYMQDFYNAVNQQGFNQQLGRGVSNQMYQPPRSDYDIYTATRRPNYMPYGPNQQFYQPIYQPSYSQFSPMGYGQAPFGGFYQPPMMGLGQQFGQTQFGAMNFQSGDPGAFRNALIRQSERKGFSQPQRSLDDLSNFDMTGQGAFRNNPMPRNMMPPGMFGPATDISDQGQADLRLRTPEGVSMHAPYDAPMLSPQPMQQQPMQQQYTPAPTQQANPVVRRIFKGNFSRAFGGQQPSNFPYSVNYGAPMISPQPMQSQYRPIPYMTQSQLDAQQRAAQSAALAAAVTPAYDYGGGYGDAGFGGTTGGNNAGGGYSGPGSVGPEGQNASPGDDGGGVGSDGGGVGMGGDSTGEGVFQSGGKVRKQSYGGIDSLLRK